MERKVLNNPGGGDLVIIQGRIWDTGFGIWRGMGKSQGKCLLKFHHFFSPVPENALSELFFCDIS